MGRRILTAALCLSSLCLCGCSVSAINDHADHEPYTVVSDSDPESVSVKLLDGETVVGGTVCSMESITDNANPGSARIRVRIGRNHAEFSSSGAALSGAYGVFCGGKAFLLADTEYEDKKHVTYLYGEKDGDICCLDQVDAAVDCLWVHEDKGGTYAAVGGKFRLDIFGCYDGCRVLVVNPDTGKLDMHGSVYDFQRYGSGQELVLAEDLPAVVEGNTEILPYGTILMPTGTDGVSRFFFRTRDGRDGYFSYEEYREGSLVRRYIHDIPESVVFASFPASG